MEDNKNINILTIITFLVMLFLIIVVYMAFIGIRKKEVYISTYPTSTQYSFGEQEGETPVSLELRSGTYTIDFSGEGYEPSTKEFSVPLFKKHISFTFELTSLPEYKYLHSKGLTSGDQLGLEKGVPLDDSWKEKEKHLREKYPFYDELPAKGDYFYISIPTLSDKFFISVLKEEEDRAKKAALRWFSSRGVKSPPDLNIIWRYSNEPE